MGWSVGYAAQVIELFAQVNSYESDAVLRKLNRAKASILDQHGRLSVAKFPKETDTHCVERWEAIALELVRCAGITVSDHTIEMAGDKPVFLSHRFDRNDAGRVPFISAMAMLGGKDGESYSYLVLADIITSESVVPERDREELYLRVAFPFS